mmetsp:Transcript_99452/g.190994  ORF Transcript_99452/g.190994 Transcript_99452/m.190994 type:complete len:445 (-) Transcript_99452:100-1434(-)
MWAVSWKTLAKLFVARILACGAVAQERRPLMRRPEQHTRHQLPHPVQDTKQGDADQLADGGNVSPATKRQSSEAVTMNALPARGSQAVNNSFRWSHEQLLQVQEDPEFEHAVINQNATDWIHRWGRRAHQQQMLQDDSPAADEHSCEAAPEMCPTEVLWTGSSSAAPVRHGDRNKSDIETEVELVVSTYDEDLGWLSAVTDPITVYVHNRSRNGMRTHTVGWAVLVSSGQDGSGNSSKPDVEKLARAEALPKRPVNNPSGHEEIQIKLARAEASQKELKRKNKARPHPIKFIDIPNIGDEALPFLTHIVKHFDNLSLTTLFLHGHRCSWHSFFDMEDQIQKIRKCMPSAGYINLNSEWRAFCYPTDSAHPRVWMLRHLWPTLFVDEFGALPENWCMDCCAQFAVSRDVLHSHDKAFYQRLLAAVTHGETTMEYFWRMLFVPGFK